MFVELLVFVALKEVELVFVLVLLTVVLLDVEELVLVLLRVVFVVLLVVVTRRMTLDQQRAAHPPAPSSSRHAVQATAHVAVAFSAVGPSSHDASTPRATALHSGLQLHACSTCSARTAPQFSHVASSSDCVALTKLSCSPAFALLALASSRCSSVG